MKRRAFIRSRNKIRSCAILPQPKQQKQETNSTNKPGHRRFGSDPTMLRNNSIPGPVSFTPSKKKINLKPKVDTGGKMPYA